MRLSAPFRFATPPQHRLAIGAAVVLACLWSAPMAQAAAWQVCRLDLTIQSAADKSQVQAKVERVSPSADATDCPKTGEIIRFTPETADYQSLLPRKTWPKVGSKQRWRYIYLHGFCKNDGNSAACVIRHYPKGWD